MLGISNSAVAESLNSYCISQTGQQEQAKKPQENLANNHIPSFISSVKNLPELYQNPCNTIERFLFECLPKTFFSYSPTLDRVFMQGYRKTNWGGDFVHLEISEEGTKSVPDALIDSGFAEDIPELNGVLFEADSGEALFYDGSKVTNLSSYFPKVKGEKEVRSWYFEDTSEGRMFLVVDFVREKGYPFLMELKIGLNFIFISVPKELKNTYIKLFTLSNDSRLWGVAGDTIFTEIEGRLQSVLTVSPTLRIIGPAGTEQLEDGSIAFQVENRSTKLITNYVLKHASAKNNCEIMLNAYKPVLLKPELSNK